MPIPAWSASPTSRSPCPARAPCRAFGPNAEVAKGAPIATFSANLLDMLKGNLTEEQLNPGNIEKLFGHQMKGT